MSVLSSQGEISRGGSHTLVTSFVLKVFGYPQQAPFKAAQEMTRQVVSSLPLQKVECSVSWNVLFFWVADSGDDITLTYAY